MFLMNPPVVYASMLMDSGLMLKEKYYIIIVVINCVLFKIHYCLSLAERSIDNVLIEHVSHHG